MKLKKLLSFMLCLVIICAGLPAMVAQADDAFIGAKTHTINFSNRTNAFTYNFSLSKRGVIAFTTSHLYDVNGEELYLRYEIYSTSNSTTPVWSSYTNKMDATETSKYFYALIGLDGGNYQLKISPSIYSSSFPTQSETYSCYYSIDFYDYDCYETENNNTKDTADVVTFDSPVYAYLDASEDYYAITVSKDTLARIKFKGYSNIKNYTYIKLHPADGGTVDYLLTNEANAGSDHYYFDVQLKAGTNYLNLTASSQKGQLDYWFEITKDVKPATPVFTKKNATDTRIEYYWTTISGIDGYEVWRKAGSASWVKYTTFGSQYNGFYDQGITAGKTYKYKVRSYKTINGVKQYSDWSKIMTHGDNHPTAELKKINGKWYYYEDGIPANASSTLLKINGKWFFVQNGLWTAKTGLVSYRGKTFYVKGGKWSTSVNGLIKIGSTYYHIKSGKWSKTTTLVKKGSDLCYVKSGKWSKTTAIVKYNGKKYYVKKGIAQTKYSGKAKISGKTYTVKKGIIK